MELDAIVARGKRVLEEHDARKEQLLRMVRDAIKNASRAIQAMHRREDVGTLITDLRADLDELVETFEGHPELWYSNIMESATQELAEALIFHSVINHDELPDPDELKVSYRAYVMGMGDAIGELRRFVLDEALNGEFENAMAHTQLMEDMYNALMQFRFSGVRRKQDVARALIEKTKGELLIAKSKG